MIDKHPIIENADFSCLDKIYEGKTLYFGDLHCHSDSGGRSDGKEPIGNYVQKMKELNVDFAAIVDHRQMRHMFLDEWDENYFICGSEPGLKIDGFDQSEIISKSLNNHLHYILLFPDKYGLSKVLKRYSRYKFEGDELTGEFGYPCFSRDEFKKLAEYVYSLGGLVTHAHPKQVMQSDDPMDYYFGDIVPLETIYCYKPERAATDTSDNRELWVALLNMGKRMHTYGCSDTHTEASNRGLSALYVSEHSGKAALEVWRSGNLCAGAVGIKMSIDSTPMGSSVRYAPDKTLYIKTDKFHPAYINEGDTFTLSVYTENGIAYSVEFDGTPISVALEVRDRMYYRAEITDKDGRYIAISNPIWLDK